MGKKEYISSFFPPINWDTGVAAPTQSQVDSAFEVSHPSGCACDMGPFVLLSPWKSNHCAPQYSAMSFQKRYINLNHLKQTSYLNLCFLCPDLEWATGQKEELLPSPLWYSYYGIHMLSLSTSFLFKSICLSVCLFLFTPLHNLLTQTITLKKTHIFSNRRGVYCCCFNLNLCIFQET